MAAMTRRPHCAGRGPDTENEEHVAVVAEPGSEYISHVTPLSGKAIDRVNELISIATSFADDVCVLGCDGTAVNNGKSEPTRAHTAAEPARAHSAAEPARTHTASSAAQLLLGSSRGGTADNSGRPGPTGARSGRAGDPAVLTAVPLLRST